MKIEKAKKEDWESLPSLRDVATGLPGWDI